MQIKFGLNDELLIPLSSVNIKCEPIYFNAGIKGSIEEIYARASVVNMLLSAQRFLPNGLKFKVWDAYRPIEVQQSLWDSFYRHTAKTVHPDTPIEEIERLTKVFVSKPSYDENNPSIHNTGGAVDLTLISDFGYELNMGTVFDDFTEKAQRNYFKTNAYENEVHKNRQILTDAMLNAGFTAYDEEWWHFDYGDTFWSKQTGKEPLYKGIMKL